MYLTRHIAADIVKDDKIVGALVPGRSEPVSTNNGTICIRTNLLLNTNLYKSFVLVDFSTVS